MPETRPTGILKGAIIKAADIYSRYSTIIGNLLDKAHSNINASNGLTAQINTFKNAMPGDANAGPRLEFQYLESGSYHEITSKLSEISTDFKELEMQWHGSDNDNSAHGGIQEYGPDGQYTDYDSRRKNPLHVIKKININDDNYPADGRVNQSDFIGAYHFQSTIESLYAIASRLRDVCIRIERDGKINTGYGPNSLSVYIGQENPYIDLELIKNNPGLITGRSINLESISGKDPNKYNKLSVYLIPFHDYILNHDLDGGLIKVGDDDEKKKHGWAKTRDDPNVRYPSTLTSAMETSEFLINRNRVGMQITRNLRDRRTEVQTGGTIEQSKLSNFYFNDRNESGNIYEKAPVSGIANEYLTLKFGNDVEISSDEYFLKSHSTPSNDLNRYFFKNIPERYNDDKEKSVITSTNVIRSKTAGNKHVVCAQTVNDMFRQMNLMLVQISSSLYGRFEEYYTEGQITDYGSGNPRGGLGYPEIFSWYSGNTSPAGVTENFKVLNVGVNTSIEEHTNTYGGTLRSNCFVANEDDNSWKSIKCGYPWMTKSYRLNYRKDNQPYPITNIVRIYDGLTGSTVPMSFNGGYSTPSPSLKKENLSDTNGGSSNFFGASSNGTYVIKNSMAVDKVNKQVFTRYCISHPTELSAEKRITAEFYPSNSKISSVDINSKYLFMPYMMYLDDWYKNSKNSIYTGTFLSNDMHANKEANCFRSECGMPVGALNRSEIWDKSKVSAANTGDFSNYSNISVGLLVSKDRGVALSKCDVIGRNYIISSIDYVIEGVNSVNEVNHTHEGYHLINLSVETTKVFTGKLPYLGTSNPKGTVTSTISETGGNISSTVYYGFNSYNAKNSSYEGILSTFYKDAIDAMYYDKYKFNDFYDDDDLLATDVDVYSDISKYFSCGGNNLYLGGNKTMFWKWKLTKPLSIGSKNLKLYPYFENHAQKKHTDGKSMIQGNFFFSGNHEDTIDLINRDPGIPTKLNGTCHYKYIPLPDPVTISSFTIDSELSANTIVMRGFCHAWWNNLSQVILNLDFNSQETLPMTISASETYTTETNYPRKTNSKNKSNRPFNASQVEANVDFSNNRTLDVHSEWNEAEDRFDFDISCSIDIPEDYGEDFNIGYKFINEDGGSREYSNIIIPAPYPPSSTIVWFNTGEICAYSISGTFNQNSITDMQISDATKVKLGRSITSIGSGAMQNCSNLTAVKIPTTVSIISGSAFQNCTALSTITLPSSISSIGSNAFAGCSNLSFIRSTKSPAPSVQFDTFGTDASTWTGRNSYDSETNILEIHHGATGYDSGAWNDPLQNESCCGFNVQYIITPEGKTVVKYSNGGIAEYSIFNELDSSSIPSCDTAVSIKIGTAVTSIGSHAFDGCDVLTSVTIPTSVTEIKTAAFQNCSSLSSITIPESIELIEDFAFCNCSSLESIEIPSSLTTIEDNVFDSCTNLSSVNIPSGTVESIGNDAFAMCTSLPTITIPEGVTRIGNDAFKGCSNLTSIEIPESMSSIGDKAFDSCINLSSITCLALISPTTSTEQNTNPFGTDENTWTGINTKSSGNKLYVPQEAIKYDAGVWYEPLQNQNKCGFTVQHLGYQPHPETIVWYNDDTVEKYDIDTFTSSVVTSHANAIKVDLGYRVESLESQALITCTNLSSFIVPDNSRLANIKYGALSGCSNLSSFTIPSDVTSIGEDSFRNSGLTSISIPSKVKDIGSYAFGRCASLSNVIFTLENGQLTSIGTDSFRDCTNLSTIEMPNSLQRIRDRALSGCTNLTSIEFTENCQLSVIYQQAFQNCSKLKSITIPSGVKNIPEHAFQDCSDLSSVSLPNGLTSISTLAFLRCSNLSSIVIPSSVSSIGDNAFEDCTSLEEIEFPSSMSCLNNGLLWGCTNLSEVIIPSTITTISSLVFCDCTNLLSVDIPNGVTNIGWKAFTDCTNLASVILPRSLRTIEGEVFSGCLNLSSITCLARGTSEVPSVLSDTFGTDENTWTGINTKSSESGNSLHTHINDGFLSGAWLDPLRNASKCHFAQYVDIP